MRLKSRLLAGAAAALALGARVGNAQTPQLNTQIELLQQQIQQMQRQLQALQSQVNAQAQQQQRAAAPPASAPAAASAPGPHVTQTPGNRFGIESADGNYSIALTGRLHLDTGGYVNYHQASHSTTPADLNSGVNARRARLGVVGKFAGDWNYTFIYDFGGSSDSFNSGVSGFSSSGIEAAYLTYNGLYHGPFPLAFDLGYQDTPFTLDEATSSNDIMFMERASPEVIATEFGSGDNRSAVGVRSNDSRYWAGIYATGPTSGAAHNSGEPLSVFGRLTYQVLSAPDYSLHFGADIEHMFKPQVSVVGGAETFTLSDRPELRIDPTSLISAPFGTASGFGPVHGGSVYGLEAAGGYDNLFFQSEGYNYQVDRVGLPNDEFWGGYLEGSVTLTGEHRTYIPATGAYSGINPTHPFSLKTGGWGAFELAARVSYIDLNDNFIATAPSGGALTTNSVEGGQQTIYSLGLNWYVNPNMRFMFDYLHGTVKKTGSVATIGAACTGACGKETGANFDALAMRAQVAF
ncbi:MAG TPA: porin [Stellaceae bacterium]|nr:porin [Stellaceae bacterium]